MNMKYSNSSILERIKAFKELASRYKYNKYLLIMLISNITILFSKKLNKRTKSFITLFAVISLVLAAWAPNAYSHYLIQLAPCVTLEFIFFMYILEQKIKESQILNYKIIKELPINFIYICAIFIITLDVLKITTEFKGIFIVQMKLDEIVINKVSEVKKYIDEDDELLVLGNNSYYYLLFDKIPETKYFFQLPIIE